MDENLLAVIGKSIIGAALIGIPVYYFKIPLILAYVLAGIFLGPHLGIGAIQDPENIFHIAEVGLVFLLFILGLEINLKNLLQTGKAVLISGLSQIIGTFLLAILVFKYFNYSSGYSLVYLAVACSLSSTLIVVKILSDQMDLDSVPSRITLGVLVIQDIFAIGFLALQPNLNDLEINTLLISFSKVALLVILSWGLARFVLPKIFKQVSRQPELMLIMAMAWCFGVCGIASYLKLSIEMGALVAGISIASYPYHYDLVAKISSLRDFFITLFFVGLGLQITIPSMEVLKLTSIIIVFVLVSRILTMYPALYFLKYANRSSLLPAINLSQLSEFALILGTIGVSYKHISQDILSAFILASVITALISSVIMPKAHSIYKKINPSLVFFGFQDQVIFDQAPEKVQSHSKVILLGFYKDASSLLHELFLRYSNDYLDGFHIVDFNPEAHGELKKLGIKCTYGDVSNIDTLRGLNLEKAEMVICSIPDKILKGTTNYKMLMLLKQLAPDAIKIVTAENIEYAIKLYDEGADYVYFPRTISAHYLTEVIERINVEGPLSIKEDALNLLRNRKEVIP